MRILTKSLHKKETGNPPHEPCLNFLRDFTIVFPMPVDFMVELPNSSTNIFSQFAMYCTNGGTGTTREPNGPVTALLLYAL